MNNVSKCTSLNHIIIVNINLTKSSIQAMEGVLKTFEKLSIIFGCRIEGNAYEDFLKLCVNLKYLELSLKEIAIECLPQKYPTLEWLKLPLIQNVRSPR